MPTRAPIIIVVVPLLAVLFFLVTALIQGNPGFKVDKTQHGLFVSQVLAESNPIRKGDLIISLQGVPYRQVLGFLIFPTEYTADSTVTLNRDDRELVLQVETSRFTLAALFLQVWPRLLLIAFFLVLGLIARSRAPDSDQVRLFFLMLTGLSTSIAATLASSLGLISPAVVSASFLLLTVSNWFSFAAWLHFACRFPASRDLVESKRLPVVIIYLATPLTAVLLALANGGLTPDFWTWLQRFRNLLLPGIILFAFTKHCVDYRKLQQPQLKNQLKMPLAAYWLSFAPYLFLYLLPNLIIDQPLISFRLVIVAFFALPLAYLSSLIRYGLFDVDRLLARIFAAILLIGAFVACYTIFLTLLKRWLFGDEILSEQLFMLFFIIVVLLFQPALRKLESFINRFLFRNHPVPAEVLHRFSDKISSLLSRADLIKTIVEELPERINVAPVAIMLFEDGKNTIHPENRQLCQINWVESLVVAEFQKPRKTYIQTDFLGHNGSLEQELSELRKTGFSLLLPMRTSEGLTGMMLVGSKKDGRIFSRDDIHLMSSLANQGAIALENARRHESLIASKRQIEELFQQRVQQEKMAAIGEMTATVAHELKNPLGIIRSSAQYLKDGLRPEEVRREMLSYIVDEVDHLNESVTSLFDIIRQPAPRFDRVDPQQDISTLCQRWQQSRNHNPLVSLELEIAPSARPFQADFKQLSQVLLNLIRNSEEAMPDGGSIHLYIACDESGIVLRVLDSGPGIDDNAKPHIFSNFFTTKEKGIGLGLVVCRQIVTAHNGTIELKNRENGGTVATITLPSEPSSPPHSGSGEQVNTHAAT